MGKTAIVEGLAQRIVNDEVPETLAWTGSYSWTSRGSRLGPSTAGSSRSVSRRSRRAIQVSEALVLFIDELHTVVGAGAAEGSMDASNMLKLALARGELHVVGATTVDEYRKNIEKDAALERRFQPVLVGASPP